MNKYLAQSNKTTLRERSDEEVEQAMKGVSRV